MLHLTPPGSRRAAFFVYWTTAEDSVQSASMQNESSSPSLTCRWLQPEPLSGPQLLLSGSLTLHTCHTLIHLPPHPALSLSLERFALDLGQLDYLDSAGALMLLDLQRRFVEGAVRIVNASPEAERLLAMVSRLELDKPPLKQHEQFSVLEHLGRVSLELRDDVVQILSFLGELTVIMARSVRRPSLVRWASVLLYMRRAGLDGLPIVGLISLLVGVVMAFMSALQLKQFGADIYVAALVGLAIVKELGPMMTAIIVAGRSGAAFSAEIGTMMVNLEVDALTTMGFNPIAFLAQPKVLAAMLVVPALTVYSFVFGIGGGMLVGVLGLNLSVYTYVQQTIKAITVFDLVASLVKSVVFAFLIAGIGCQRGFQVRGGAEAVGALTTSAVVSAIFLVIVADSIFAILLHYLGN